MRLNALNWLWACAAFLVIGCGHRESDEWLDGKTHTARPDDAVVDIYANGSKPDRPYTPISIIRIKGTDGPGIIAKMRHRARQRGADAVILTQDGNFTEGTGIIYNVTTSDHEPVTPAGPLE